MAFRHRIANLFRHRRVDAEIEAELRAHLEMRTDDNLAAGMTPAEARREARLRFGNPAVMRERVTAADTELRIAGLGRDLRYACRQLRHSPGFALTAILTLALGIGVNVVVLSVLQSLVLHPLHLPNQDRLTQIVQKAQGDISQSYPDFLDYRARGTTFTDIAAYRLANAALSANGFAKASWLYEVSGNYFDLLSVRPALGRFFHSSDERGPNSAPYIVLSDVFWRNRFHADPGIVGQKVDLNRQPFTIVGVAPAGFHGTEAFLWPDFWIPMLNEQQVGDSDFLNARGSHGIWVLGLLKPGVTTRQAQDNLNTIAGQLAKQYPASDDGLGARLVRPGLMGDLFGDPARTFLLGTLLLASLVLLAACANLAGIFAARTADRSRELAIRLAIGSSRYRILRQLLIEALFLAAAGGAFGTLLAAAFLHALTRWQPFSEYPIQVTVNPDLRVYCLAVFLSLASGMLFGLLPSRQIWQTNTAEIMKGGAPNAPLSRRLTLRDVLLGIQISLCTLLITASLVAFRGMAHSLKAPIGFHPQGAVLATTDLQMAGYLRSAWLPLNKRLLDAALTVPGVTAAGTINTTPLNGSGSTTTVYRDGATEFKVSRGALGAKYFYISPGYLAAAQTRLIAGHDFNWQNGPAQPRAAIVNQVFAHRLFGEASAIGQHFMMSKDARYEIVGVVEDGKYDSLTENPWAAVFFPMASSTDGRATLVFRSRLAPADAARELSRILTGVDPTLPISIERWTDNMALVLFPARVGAAALGVMGLLAVMLALTGIFGMAAYSVSKRLRELGIRIALGAHRRQLLTAALKRPLVLLLSGSAIGLLLGVLASRLLAQIVYQATPRDPVVLLGTVAAMVGLGLVATWIPARRALRIDPARLLREE